MFSILLRRLQKFLSVVKLLVLAGSLSGIIFVVFNVPPAVVPILTVCVLIFVFLLTAGSVFLKTKTAFLVSFSVSFVLFLKAVDLLTPLNLGLFGLLIVFLIIYLYKQAQKK